MTTPSFYVGEEGYGGRGSGGTGSGREYVRKEGYPVFVFCSVTRRTISDLLTPLPLHWLRGP